MSNDQAKFEGWAVVEVMGHQKYVGYVTTEAYGAAVLFRVDVPELPQREIVTRGGGYINGQWAAPGTTVLAEAVQGYTKLVGASSIYCITPCTEEAAMELLHSRPAATPPEDEDDDFEEDDDTDLDTALAGFAAERPAGEDESDEVGCGGTR